MVTSNPEKLADEQPEKLPEELLRFNNVSKSFGPLHALVDINLHVNAGEILAILGCNGAGKTTLMNLAAGIKQPSSGQIQIFAKPATSKEAKRKRTVLPQDLSFPPHLKVRDILVTVYGHFKGSDWRPAVHALDLENLLGRYTSELSGGERRKLSIACALAGSPRLILLDEPTANIDLIGQISVRTLLRKYFEDRGASLIFTSHQMREVEELADRVIVLTSGRLVANSTVKDLKGRLGLKKVRYVASNQAGLQEKLGPNSDDLLKEILRLDPAAHSIEISEPTLEESIIKIWQQPGGAR